MNSLRKSGKFVPSSFSCRKSYADSNQTELRSQPFATTWSSMPKQRPTSRRTTTLNAQARRFISVSATLLGKLRTKRPSRPPSKTKAKQSTVAPKNTRPIMSGANWSAGTNRPSTNLTRPSLPTEEAPSACPISAPSLQLRKTRMIKVQAAQLLSRNDAIVGPHQKNTKPR